MWQKVLLDKCKRSGGSGKTCFSRNSATTRKEPAQKPNNHPAESLVTESDGREDSEDKVKAEHLPQFEESF